MLARAPQTHRGPAVLPYGLHRDGRHAGGGNQGAVEDRVGVPGGPALLQDLVQVRGVDGQGGDGFVQIPVRGASGIHDSIFANPVPPGPHASFHDNTHPC